MQEDISEWYQMWHYCIFKLLKSISWTKINGSIKASAALHFKLSNTNIQIFLFLSVSLFCSPPVFIIKMQSSTMRLIHHPEYTSFNHSGIFIYSNYIPKCNWFPVPFIYSELETSLKYRFYDTFPPPCYIS